MKQNKIFKILGAGLFGLLSVLFIFAAIFYSTPSLEITAIMEKYETIKPTIIYDVNGNEIDSICKNNRELADIGEVPKVLINAFISVEDKNFFKHHGFDLLRIFKAAITDVIHFKKMQGASTITQQLSKNAFLNNSKSFDRKLKEAVITFKIERKYTKEQILEKYLNEIYFGRGVYGVKTAAKYFFGKNLSEITLNEAAFLAGLPQKPSHYALSKNAVKAEARRNVVLKSMYKNGYISYEEYNKSKAEPVKLKNIHERIRYPSFTDEVLKKVSAIFDIEQLRENGVKIYTTLDLGMQQAAEEAFYSSKYFEKYPDVGGSLVVIESSTGYVKAIIGDRNYMTGGYNRVMKAKRQVGSAIKPFVCLTAFQNGYQPNLIIEDSSIKYGDWAPRNDDRTFRGNVTVQYGLEHSVNIFSIKLLERVGLNRFIEVCKSIGIDEAMPLDLTAALGTASLTPMEFAKAYAIFSNGGSKIEEHIFVTRIEDANGNLVYEAKPKLEKIFEEEKIALVVELLKNNIASNKVFELNSNYKIERGGKSGTSNDFRDAWFAGVTADFVTIVHAGYDDNRPMAKDMYGAKVCGDIWNRFIEIMLKKAVYEPSKFEFVNKLIEDGKLSYQYVDAKNGLFADETTKIRQKILLDRAMLPSESSEKYKNGLVKFIN